MTSPHYAAAPAVARAAAHADARMPAVRAILHELQHLEPEVASGIEADLTKAGAHRLGADAAHARALTLLHRQGLAKPRDPDETAREHAVWFTPHLDFDALTQLHVTLDTGDAVALDAVIEERARSLRENSPPGAAPPAGSLRVKALLDLALENSRVSTTLHLWLTYPGCHIEKAAPRFHAA
ncbi:MAG: hypothetical protein DI618_04905 [Dermacoccus nishinomiyaensis]|nr:MAG: hypothetical protein DI618_04905 [Dermacoccus nishinomiyaensis]